MEIRGRLLEIARWQFGITTVYHFVMVPLTLGLGPLVAVMQTAVGAHRRRAVPADDQVLGQALPDQLHHGRGDRPRAGVPVRHGVERVLALRRRRLRRPARHGGPARLLRRVDVPRPVDLRLGPPAEEDPPRHALDRRDRLDRLGVLHHRRELVDAASRRRRARRRPPRHDRHLGGAHQQHRRSPPTRTRSSAPSASAAPSWSASPGTSCGSAARTASTRWMPQGRVVVGERPDVPGRDRADHARLDPLAPHRRGRRDPRIRRRRDHRRPAGQAHVRAAADEDGRGRGRLPRRHRASRSSSIGDLGAQDCDEVVGVIEIPGLLSFLAHGDFDDRDQGRQHPAARVPGEVRHDLRRPVYGERAGRDQLRAGHGGHLLGLPPR